jgi:hypothetical protein
MLLKERYENERGVKKMENGPQSIGAMSHFISETL